MPPLNLPLAQRISLQFRLDRRVIVSASVKGRKRESAVGLEIHTRADHRCADVIRLDWGGEKTTPEAHPWLYLKGCPGQHYDPLLSALIQQVIALEDMGGLGPLAPNIGIVHLPERLVEFYRAVLAAEKRFVAETNHAQQKLYSGQ